MLPAATYPDVDPFERVTTDPPVSAHGPIDLKRAIRDWGEVYYAPLDASALDPPEVCERCRRPISADDALDYLDADDGSLLIVHEGCRAAA